jgi:thiol-disulfide isomerase/thioredoxin
VPRRGEPRRIAVLALLSLVTAPWAATAAVPDAKPLEAALRRLDGEREKLSDLRGRRLLLELWATWCEPCREQAGVVRALAGELARLGVEVIAINEGEERETVVEFLVDNPSHARVLLDRGQLVAARLDVGSLPAIALVREDGTVAATREGLVQREELAELLRASFAAPAEPADVPPEGP